MTLELLKNKIPDFNRLRDFGFAKADGKYSYSTLIAGGQFEVTIIVSEAGALKTKVVDRDSQEEYVLHLMEAASGAFVGMVRTGHDELLQKIVAACFDTVIFKSAQTQRVIAYARANYGVELEFLWQKFPNNAVWRRQDTNKWFGALLTVAQSKLGLPSEEFVEIIDLRGPTEMIATLVDGKKYYQGYHMNKKHWYTIILDGSVPVEEICARLDASYRLALK